MPSNIEVAFCGHTLWNNDSGGAGYRFRPGATVRRAIEAAAPLGTGYWVKLENYGLAQHTLVASWYGADPEALRAAVLAFADGRIGTLAVHGYGSYANCRLSECSDFDVFKTDSTHGHVVSATLTFTQYP